MSLDGSSVLITGAGGIGRESVRCTGPPPARTVPGAHLRKKRAGDSASGAAAPPLMASANKAAVVGPRVKP